MVQVSWPQKQLMVWGAHDSVKSHSYMLGSIPIDLLIDHLHSRLPTIQQEVQQRKLLYMGLYLLIWGEAANLRFMPECLCYIYHHVWTILSFQNNYMAFTYWTIEVNLASVCSSNINNYRLQRQFDAEVVWFQLTIPLLAQRFWRIVPHSVHIHSLCECICRVHFCSATRTTVQNSWIK